MFRAGPAMPCTVRQFSWAGSHATFPSQRICLSLFSLTIAVPAGVVKTFSPGRRPADGAPAEGAQERPRRNFRRGPVMQTVSILSFFAPVTNRFTRNQVMPREKLPKSKHRNHHANAFFRSAAFCSAFEPPHLQVVRKEALFVNAGLSCQRRAVRCPAGISGILPFRTVFRLIPFPYRLKPWSNGLRLPGLLILVPAHWIHSLLKKSPISSRCLPLVFLPAARAAVPGKPAPTSVVPFLSATSL